MGKPKSNTENFIKKANEIHGIKYIYDKVNYTNNSTNVIILTEEDFEKSKLRDNLKLDYCSKNNIPLFIIKYNEDIKEKCI